MEFIPPGVYRIEHLHVPWPWTAGLTGLVKWLTWETENVLGISKTELRRRVIAETVQLYQQGIHDPDQIEARIEKQFYKELRQRSPWDRSIRPRPRPCSVR